MSTAATVSGTSLSVNQPAGTQVGDVIVAALTVPNPGTLGATGWTTAATQTQTGQQTWVLWRTATATDPASWTFTTSGAFTTLTAAVTDYKNPGGTPIGVAATAANASATSQPLPQVTTTGDGQTLVHVVGYNANVTPTAPAGTNQRATVSAAASLLVAERYQSRPGQSTALSATSNVATTSAALTVALQPVSNTSRIGYQDHSDNSGYVQNTAGSVTGLTIGLVGGATYDYGPTGAVVWSYANLHGDTIETADSNGNRTWTGYMGPYGETASGTTPANSILPGANYGYNGQQNKLTDSNTIQMGARPYQPALGRFLTVDPQQGGCANLYTYSFGDPTNQPDLSGKSWWNPTSWKWAGKCGILAKGYRALKNFAVDGVAIVAAGQGAAIAIEGILLAPETAGVSLLATAWGIVVFYGAIATINTQAYDYIADKKRRGC